MPPMRRYRRPKCLLQWLVGILAFAAGMISFQLLHSTFDVASSDGVSEDCPTAPRRPSTLTNTTFTTARFAYAFLISGCDPSSPLTYRPYIWNILVATKNLLGSGSVADVVVMVQMAKGAGNELPIGDLQWLELYPKTIRVHYLPPLLRDNFYNAQLAKFHVLELPYERVMYLDADVMPLCNLDYILEFSVTGRLQSNVVLAWFTEPAHGGLFVLEPGNFEEWKAVVERREQEALELPYPHWDPVRGWGKTLGKEWEGLPQPVESLADGTHRYAPPRHSTNWTFHGDFADQGLLYYWTRFHQKSVSILYLDTVLDYVGDNEPIERSSADIFGTSVSCLPRGMEYQGQYGSTLQAPLFYEKVPHRDFCHFSGEGKPWSVMYREFPSTIHSSTDYWYAQLQAVFQDFERLHPGRKLPSLPLKYKAPSLGRYPTHRAMIGTIQKKLRHKQKQEEREQTEELQE